MKQTCKLQALIVLQIFKNYSKPKNRKRQLKRQNSCSWFLSTLSPQMKKLFAEIYKNSKNKDSSLQPLQGLDFCWVFSICVLHATWLPQSTGPVNCIQMQITAIKSCWSWANILCQASKRSVFFLTVQDRTW